MHALKAPLEQRRRFQVSPVGASCFETTVFTGNRDLARLLQRYGANVNDRNAVGSTAMHVAIATRNEGMQQFSMAFNSDLSVIDSNKSTLLHEAAASWDVKVEKLSYGSVFSTHLLLNADSSGLDINARNSYGDTPLHTAARLASREIVKLLIDAGALIDLPNKYNKTPACVAAGENKTENLQYLLQAGAQAGVTSVNHLVTSPLHQAVYRGVAESTMFLLRQPARSVSLQSIQVLELVFIFTVMSLPMSAHLQVALTLE